MKTLIHSIFMTFSIYSKIPMPYMEWKQENMYYVLGLFPLVGMVEGILLLCIYHILQNFTLPLPLLSSILTAFPILFTGGIHMDGFMDTLDALGSHASRKRKLEIMKDSHIGASAVIGVLLYILLYFSACFGLNTTTKIFSLGILFTLERAYSTLALIYFPNARGSGMAHSITDMSKRKTTKIILILWIIFMNILLFLLDFKIGFSLSIISFGIFLFYKIQSKKEFGGVTGDTSGYFLQICELSGLIIISIIF